MKEHYLTGCHRFRSFIVSAIRVADPTLRHVVRVWHNLWCAAQILEHVLRLRSSRAFTQKVIRSAQGAYFFRYRRRDEFPNTSLTLYDCPAAGEEPMPRSATPKHVESVV
jgi:hypothetical protein